MKKRVAVGMSGGVDSSVAAALLVEQGYEVAGVYLTCWSGAGCRSEEDRKDALDISLQLNIPFVHLDFQKEYKKKVYEYMIREYEAGRTPNPDVMCNKEIKFGMFYMWALAQGYDFVATGHYAQISRKSKIESLKSENLSLKPLSFSLTRSVDEHKDPRKDFSISSTTSSDSENQRGRQTYFLQRAVDAHKDQTYFLYQLREEQLEHILFPIGHLTKLEVRTEAEKRGLLSAKKPDSQGICFIGEMPMGKFLRERIKEKEGEIHLRTIQTDQTIRTTTVGHHRGVWFYTIGQKVAITQSKQLAQLGFDPANLPHFYVIEKDVARNILIVGTEEMLDKNEILINEFHSITNNQVPIIKQFSKSQIQNLCVRIRHTGELIKVSSVECKVSSQMKIHLSKSVRGVAPGQAAVFYQGQVCLGGGVIC